MMYSITPPDMHRLKIEKHIAGREDEAIVCSATAGGLRDYDDTPPPPPSSSSTVQHVSISPKRTRTSPKLTIVVENIKISDR
jgi:hypothetical protein